jgi:hypothetical protein
MRREQVHFSSLLMTGLLRGWHFCIDTTIVRRHALRREGGCGEEDGSQSAWTRAHE